MWCENRQRYDWPRRKVGKPGQRTMHQRKLDRIMMVKMLCQGASLVQVAQVQGISPAAAKGDFDAAVRELVSTMHNIDLDSMRKLALAQYAEMKVQAWDAFQRCQLERVKRETEERLRQVAEKEASLDPSRKLFPTFKMVKVGKKETREKRVEGEGFLKIIADCLKAERELMGLDAPKQVNVTGQMAVTWDQVVQGLPQGCVTDEVEAEIAQVLGKNGVHVNGLKELGHNGESHE